MTKRELTFIIKEVINEQSDAEKNIESIAPDIKTILDDLYFIEDFFENNELDSNSLFAKKVVRNLDKIEKIIKNLKTKII